MNICIKIDSANPGQFFACCGLLELTDRLWGGAKGAFSPAGSEFSIVADGNSATRNPDELRLKLASCQISSTMTDEQISQLKALLNQEKGSLTQHAALEKQKLSNLWKCERVWIHEPFDLWIDWWADEQAGGSDFKTWAGKQFVLDLVRGMQAQMRSAEWSNVPVSDWFSQYGRDGSLPLYFDSDIGSQSSSLDAGFSMDVLGIRSRIRPAIELAAFIGLQRFRPARQRSVDSFVYAQWTELLPPVLAAIACSGHLPQQTSRSFEFHLLYRTKYLKSFLAACPTRRSNND